MSNKSKDHKWGTLAYYRARAAELEGERNEYLKQSEYYQTELAKSHEILGRVIHQLGERWDSVRLTKYYPTDNLHSKRSINNSTGE